MSANNCYVIKRHKSKWYGWDTNAEGTGVDEDNGYKHTLHFSKSHYVAKTKLELINMMADDSLFYPEYGFATDFLPKDGTPIEFEE